MMYCNAWNEKSGVPAPDFLFANCVLKSTNFSFFYIKSNNFYIFSDICNRKNICAKDWRTTKSPNQDEAAFEVNDLMEEHPLEEV